MKALKLNVRIVVADDHGIVRMGLIQTVKRLKPEAVIFEVEDYKSLYKVILNEELDAVGYSWSLPLDSLYSAAGEVRRRLRRDK